MRRLPPSLSPGTGRSTGSPNGAGNGTGGGTITQGPAGRGVTDTTIAIGVPVETGTQDPGDTPGAKGCRATMAKAGLAPGNRSDMAFDEDCACLYYTSRSDRS